MTSNNNKEPATTFTDSMGQTWDCRIDWASMRRVRSAGFDLGNIEEMLAQFYSVSVTLVDVLWAVCELQAKSHGITQEQFEERIQGETIAAAADALVAGVVDFFPDRRKKLLTAASRKVETAVSQVFEDLQK